MGQHTKRLGYIIRGRVKVSPLVIYKLARLFR